MRFALALALYIVVPLVLPNATEAQATTDAKHLARLWSVEVSPLITASGECSVREHRIKTVAELELRRAGIPVGEVDPADSVPEFADLPPLQRNAFYIAARPHTLSIGVVVLDAAGGCVAALDVDVWRFETTTAPYLEDITGQVVSFSSIYTVTSGPNGLQEMVDRVAREAATELANAILEAKQEQ